MTNDNLANTEVRRSYKYMRIFEELKEWRGGAYNIAKKLYDQGIEDGLPNDIIRKDTEDVLIGVVTPRQINRALPDPLKRSGGYNSNPRKDMMSIQKTPAQAAIEFKARMSQEPAAETIIEAKQPQPHDPDLNLPPPDDSLLWGVPEDYKLELLDQYEAPYLRKVVKYLHEAKVCLEKQVDALYDSQHEIAVAAADSTNEQVRAWWTEIIAKRLAAAA